MSGWIEVNPGAAPADVLITDFGAFAISPLDARLCIDTGYWSSAAAATIRIFMAAAGGATAQNQITLADAASTTAGTAQYLTFSGDVFFNPTTGIPWTLRITSSAADSRVRLHWKLVPPGGC